MPHEEKTEWKDARKNLLAMVEKFPNTLNIFSDCLDSAYLAGLEDNNKKGEAWRKGYQAGKEEGIDFAKLKYDKDIFNSALDALGEKMKEEQSYVYLPELLALISKLKK